MATKKLSGAYVRINSHYPQLLPTEKKLADYINRNAEKLETLSISDLADNAGVSKATVTRFCKHLGYSGFKDFRMSAIRDILSGKGEGPRNPDLKNTDVGELIVSICEANANACTGTELLLDAESVSQAADLMIGAGRIFIFGEGAVAPLALDLNQKMLRLGYLCVHTLDRRLQKMHAALCNPGDVAVLFDLSGSTRSTWEVASSLKERGVATITICNTIGSPLSKEGTINLFGPGRMNSDITGTLSPRIALLCVVDCIFTVILNRTIGQRQEALDRTRQVILDDWV